MFSALFVKEWRQLRTLRMGGLALGLCLPWGIFLITELSRQSWFPGLQAGHYSVGELIRGVTPQALIALWALLALLVTAQSFSADRASGTETFLLERPVPRRTIWNARAAAAGATLVLQIGLLVGYQLLLDATLGEGPAAAPWILLGAIAGVVVLTSFAAGLLAASVVVSLQAVLLALVLTALPVGATVLLVRMFPHANYRSAPVGLLIGGLILVAFVLASHRICCFGEPAGRGRIRRGAVLLGSVLLGSPFLFAVVAPVAIRANVRFAPEQAMFLPSPSGNSGMLFDRRSGGGWLVGLADGERRQLLRPAIEHGLWNADGTRFALVTSSTALGGIGETRVEVRDESGDLLRSHTFDDRETQIVSGAFLWAGDRLIDREFNYHTGAQAILVGEPDGSFRRIAFGSETSIGKILGPTDSGEVFLCYFPGAEARQPVLRRIDLERGVLDEPRVIPRGADQLSAYGFTFDLRLSPSGRYLTNRGATTDLETGEPVSAAGVVNSIWLAGDRLVRVVIQESQAILTIGHPDEAATEIGRWPSTSAVLLHPSADRARLLITVREGAGDDIAHAWFAQGQRVLRNGRILELIVHDPSDGSVVSYAPDSRWLGEEIRLDWAGRETLAAHGDVGVALRNVQPGGDWRYLVGPR